MHAFDLRKQGIAQRSEKNTKTMNNRNAKNANDGFSSMTEVARTPLFGADLQRTFNFQFSVFYFKSFRKIRLKMENISSSVNYEALKTKKPLK